MTKALTMCDITCTLCITSHALYMTSHLLCVMSHSLCVLHHTMTIDLWHQTIGLWHIHLYGITHSVMTIQPLCASTATMPDITVYFRHYTQCTNFMKRSECMSSQNLYVWHHTHYIWHHIHSLWHHTSLFMTSSPQYLTSHPVYLTSRPLYLCSHTHSINDISDTLCMITHTVYMWRSIHDIYDIMSTMYENRTLCVVDTTLGICVT